MIVGAGLFGAVLAERLTSYGKKVLVVEKNNEIGGACATKKEFGITVHQYGAHIFRTNHRYIWNYVNIFATFKPFINSPLAYVGKDLYNLPFNMNTYHQIWGVTTPYEAKARIELDRVKTLDPKNLEEYALDKVGKTIYNLFIKEYTEKQWGKQCTELPASILGRLPLRFTYDNNYYSNKEYQGVPVEGYSSMIESMLEEATLYVNVDNWRDYKHKAKHIVYTGSIDEYYDYIYGKLEYRSLSFEQKLYQVDDMQGNAVINYTEKLIPYTRTIEHKHFLGEKSEMTIISKEYPEMWNGTNERYYPIETENNLMLYKEYANIATDVIFAGRLGSYKYTDMEQTVQNAMELALHLRYLD